MFGKTKNNKLLVHIDNIIFFCFAKHNRKYIFIRT